MINSRRKQAEKVPKQVPKMRNDGQSVVQGLRDMLAKNVARVIDLFQEWDEDGSGSISRQEFAKVFPFLGLSVDLERATEVFDLFDTGNLFSVSLVC